MQIVDGAQWFIRNRAGPIQLEQGGQHAVVNLPTDYSVGFQITPSANIISEWASIVHLSATGNNCCAYGDRVPGIWFHPGTHLLHVRDGHGDDGNAGCDPDEELPANVATTVRVEMRPGFVEVWYGEAGSDELKCTAARGDRQTFDNVVVYAADPWHAPADALINNFYVQELVPRRGCTEPTACNHDDHAYVDDGSCQYPREGFDCANNPFVMIDGATYFVPPTSPIQLTQDVEHAVVDLPTDYEVSFDIVPEVDVVANWASIIHLTATGSNCCAYGDRIPGKLRDLAHTLPR